jgi:hypothetical protein
MESVSALTSVLCEFPNLNEVDVAAIVVMMVRTHGDGEALANEDASLPLTIVMKMAVSVGKSNLNSAPPEDTGPPDIHHRYQETETETETETEMDST